MRRAGITALAIALAVAIAAAATIGGEARAGARVSASGVLALHKIANFNQPVYVDQPPGSKKLVFVVQKGGVIRVVRSGAKLPHPFLDIGKRVDTVNEAGLLSIAFDPGYAHNRRFYVFYTRLDGNNLVDMYKRSRHSPTRANPASRRRVILIHHPDTSDHNGGLLEFGPDGHLYISSGDGGCCNDPYQHAYKLNTLLGKILRIDPKPGGGYTIPRSNPRVGRPGRNEIFSWGLRNPWRFSFDPSKDRIAIGDVGQDAIEEVDYETIAGANGANFGWPEYEGDNQVDPSRPGPAPPVFPIFTYAHSAPCAAVIGGYVVRDPTLPSLHGRYVYTDNCHPHVRSFRPHLGGATGDHSLGLTVPDASSFGEGHNGRIYVASLDGPVYRLIEH